MNRSHRNSGHRAINRLHSDGRRHSSENDAPPTPTFTRQTVIRGDVLHGLRRIADGSVQLIVCDPPYNIQMAEWDVHARYVDWAGAWLAECQRVMAPHGSLVLFGGLQYQSDSGGDLLELMHHLRSNSPMRLVNLIVWNYPNGMSAHRFFANRHEEIAWFVKGPKYVFDLDAVREPYDAETLKAYSRDKRLRPATLAKGRNPTNVWRIGRLNANAAERTGHPTQKPRVLIRRLVLALSRPGDVVLDPFAGSGVTMRVCIESGRHGVAIERDASFDGYLRHQLKDLPEDCLPVEWERISLGKAA